MSNRNLSEQEISEIVSYLGYQFSMGKPSVDKLVEEIFSLKRELLTSKSLLLEARDVLGFDRFPGEEQCMEMMRTREKLANYLGGYDPWVEKCKELEIVMGP